MLEFEHVIAEKQGKNRMETADLNVVMNEINVTDREVFGKDKIALKKCHLLKGN